MSLTPETTPTSEAARDSKPPGVPGKQAGGLRRRIWLILFVIFAFEIGTFLVAFPWMDAWTLNHLPSFFPGHETFGDQFAGKIGVFGREQLHFVQRNGVSRGPGK